MIVEIKIKRLKNKEAGLEVLVEEKKKVSVVQKFTK